MVPHHNHKGGVDLLADVLEDIVSDQLFWLTTHLAAHTPFSLRIHYNWPLLCIKESSRSATRAHGVPRHALTVAHGQFDRVLSCTAAAPWASHCKLWMRIRKAAARTRALRAAAEAAMCRGELSWRHLGTRSASQSPTKGTLLTSVLPQVPTFPLPCYECPHHTWTVPVLKGYHQTMT